MDDVAPTSSASVVDSAAEFAAVWVYFVAKSSESFVCDDAEADGPSTAAVAVTAAVVDDGGEDDGGGCYAELAGVVSADGRWT